MRAALFSTTIGPCAIGWSERGVCRLQLLAGDADETRWRLEGSQPGQDPVQWAAPPAGIARLIDRLQAHLSGTPDRLTRGVPLDLKMTRPFARAAYEQLRRIPPGQTISYGDLAERSGSPAAARAIGRAMANNPIPLLIPCHRVVLANGDLGCFSAPDGARLKLRLLTLEGADLTSIARAGVRQLQRDDYRLAQLIAEVGPYRLPERQRTDHFTALAEAIVHQQLSMRAAATIFQRLMAAAASGTALDPHAVLHLTQSQLQTVGLSRQKSRYLQHLAHHVASGRLPLDKVHRMDDESLIDALTIVPGIGRWTAEMFLMFRLGRLNVLPVDDLGFRRGVRRVYGAAAVESARALRQLGEQWQPFRSIATWYLWRAQDVGAASAAKATYHSA